MQASLPHKKKQDIGRTTLGRPRLACRKTDEGVARGGPGGLPQWQMSGGALAEGFSGLFSIPAG